MRMKDINIIQDQDHYLNTINWFIRYTSRLINKDHILRKDQLRKIKHNLLTKGFIHTKYQYRLLKSYLKHEKNLDYINITDLLYSLESYTKQDQDDQQKPITLEDFFT